MEPHPHDEKWIKEQLFQLSLLKRQEAIEGYKKLFKEAYDNEPINHKKSNVARFTANSRLRKFVDKHKKAA